MYIRYLAFYSIEEGNVRRRRVGSTYLPQVISRSLFIKEDYVAFSTVLLGAYVLHINFSMSQRRCCPTQGLTVETSNLICPAKMAHVSPDRITVSSILLVLRRVTAAFSMFRPRFSHLYRILSIDTDVFYIKEVK